MKCAIMVHTICMFHRQANRGHRNGEKQLEFVNKIALKSIRWVGVTVLMDITLTL